MEINQSVSGPQTRSLCVLSRGIQSGPHSAINKGHESNAEPQRDIKQCKTPDDVRIAFSFDPAPS